MMLFQNCCYAISELQYQNGKNQKGCKGTLRFLPEKTIAQSEMTSKKREARKEEEKKAKAWTTFNEKREEEEAPSLLHTETIIGAKTSVCSE